MKKLLLTLFTLVPFLALSHAGHGENHGTVLHYLTSYWHLIPIVLLAAGAIWWVRVYRRKRSY